MNYLPFSIAVQLSATAIVSGSLCAAPRITRKRSPSGETSYFRRNGRSVSFKRSSKSGCGGPVSSRESTSRTATDISIPSRDRKKSSLPSRRQTGMPPPLDEILWTGPVGNPRTYTSTCPESSDWYASQRESVEKVSYGSSNSVVDVTRVGCFSPFNSR